MEIYDADNNQIEQVYDKEGNPIDEVLTPDEIDKKIDEAKQEAQSKFETEIKTLNESIAKKEEEIKRAIESAGKNGEKDKNWGEARTVIEGLKTEIGTLKGTIDNLSKQTAEKGVVDTINRMAGGDKETVEKVKHFYEQFKVPENDNDENKLERVKRAFQLATGHQPGSDIVDRAFGTGGGFNPPAFAGGEGKLSQEAKGVAAKLGISDKELKEHKLI